ncbi:MAG: hypothetical protein P8X67_12705 [Syntrophobacterales bacterium]
MKELIQVEIRALAFSNTPILQYSINPTKQLAIFTGIAIERRLGPEDQVFDFE